VPIVSHLRPEDAPTDGTEVEGKTFQQVFHPTAEQKDALYKEHIVGPARERFLETPLGTQLHSLQEEIDAFQTELGQVAFGHGGLFFNHSKPFHERLGEFTAANGIDVNVNEIEPHKPRLAQEKPEQPVAKKLNSDLSIGYAALSHLADKFGMRPDLYEEGATIKVTKTDTGGEENMPQDGWRITGFTATGLVRAEHDRENGNPLTLNLDMDKIEQDNPKLSPKEEEKKLLRAQRKEWLNGDDPNAVIIAGHLKETQAVLKYLGGGAKAALSEDAKAGLEAFNYNSRNPDDEERGFHSTYVAAQNSQERLLRLSEQMMVSSNNPHGIGIGKTFDMPGLLKADGAPAQGEIVGIDMYGRFEYKVPGLAKDLGIQVKTFKGFTEHVESVENRLPRTIIRARTDQRDEGWGQ
jgi:hypothetical protein